MTETSPICLAVDIGGTKIALGLFDTHGHLLGDIAKHAVPFQEDSQADPVGLTAIIDEHVKDSQTRAVELCGIGLSICGNIDLNDGNCLLIPNLHWRNVNLCKMVAEATKLPTFAATDVRQAAMAEHTWGVARGKSHFCWCTVGTGYGGYLYLDGKPFDGYHGIAGPFGHNTIDEVNGYLCGCGRRGCVETYVAGPAIARAGETARSTGRSSVLAELSAGGPVTTPTVVQAFCRGDPASVEIINNVARMIAISLGGVNNLLDLEMIILGGGVVHALPELVSLVKAKIGAYLMSEEARKDLLIEKESFSNSALYGAAAYTFARLEIRTS